MASSLNDPKLEVLLDRLHAQSEAQTEETEAYFVRREREGSLDYENFCDDDMHRFLSDKMVALDRDKAVFCYQLCRSWERRVSSKLAPHSEYRLSTWQPLCVTTRSRVAW